MVSESAGKFTLDVQPRYTHPVTFFKAVSRAFERAEAGAGGPVDRFFRIGGFPIRLRFAGPALVPLFAPALEHLSCRPTPVPALTICLWDSISTGVNMPPAPWSGDGDIARGQVRGCIVMNNGPIRTSLDLNAGALSMLDRSSHSAVYWTPDAGRVLDFERGVPLRTIFHWWMREQGRLLVHSAAVGTPDGGVLLVGKGGSGKSTAVLSCLTSELLYAGDDYVLLRSEPFPFVYSLYNSAKLDAGHLQNFPHLLSSVGNSERLDTEKALLLLRDRYPHKLSTGFPVRAIFSLRVTGLPETRLHKASVASVFAALAPSTILQMVGANQNDLRDLGAFVRRVRCFGLELGTDLRKIPDVILSFLSVERT